ncbi:MAG TPA: CRTAC1 family protein [Acidobacteriaceae bacterium]|nr:CRTAC1 family protein [Acidobacteriaceae bacterium]
MLVRFCVTAVLAVACGMAVVAGSAQSTPAAKSVAVPGNFVDVTAASGVSFTGVASHTSHKYLIETMGSGVAMFDYDDDGREDLFFVNGATLDDPTPKGTIPKKRGPKEWNRLYHQRKDGTFQDVTEKAGVKGTGYDLGVATGDFDNDGHEDLYVTGYGGNHLYHNNGDGTFTDVTERSGTGGDHSPPNTWYTSAAWVDLDNDGLLDLVVLRYVKWDFDDVWCGEHRDGYRAYCHPDLFPAIAPIVYHNNGNGTFTDVTEKVGMATPGKGLGIAIADYDRDGHIDVAVANDSMPEFLFHNKGDGTFEESGFTAEIAVDGDGRTYAGMGIAFQDFNNDGWPDLVITNLANQKYALYRNSKDGSFTYDTYATGLASMTLLHSGWGIQFLDYDNDGYKDLLVTQGHDLDTVELNYPQLHYKEPMLLARNSGDGKFVDVSAESGAIFKQRWVGRGMAVGDLDNDGRVDAVVSTNGGPAYVLHNQTATANHWLTLLLVGHKSNRDAIGAEIQVTTSKGDQYWTVSTSGSYLSANDKRAHFGLGADTAAKSIEIRWPSGIRQTLNNISGDRIVRVDEPTGTDPAVKAK